MMPEGFDTLSKYRWSIIKHSKSNDDIYKKLRQINKPRHMKKHCS